MTQTLTEEIIIVKNTNSDTNEKLQEEKAKPEEPKKRKGKGNSQGEVIRDLSDFLEGSKPPLLADFADLPWKFESILRRKLDEPQIIEIKNNTAELVSANYVASCLRKYVRNLAGKQKKYNLIIRDLMAVVDEWAMLYHRRDSLPRAVGFRSDPSLCMHRLNYDPIRITEEELSIRAPIFAEVLGRLSNNLAFCQRIGSIFDEEADRKQACWIYGPKDGGKSVITELLKILVGPQYAIIASRNLRTPYWASSLVDKRVGIVGEAPLEFIRSDDFKNVTGDEGIEILEKYEKAYQARLNVLLFFFSNPAPQIPNDIALKERIIACKLDRIPETHKKGFKEICRGMAKEAPYIVGFCIAEYEKLAKGASLSCDYNDLQGNIDLYESEYLDFFDRNLQEGGSISRNDFSNLMANSGFRDGYAQKICKEAIFSRYPCEELRINRAGMRLWIIKGISKRGHG